MGLCAGWVDGDGSEESQASTDGYADTAAEWSADGYEMIRGMGKSGVQ